MRTSSPYTLSASSSEIRGCPHQLSGALHRPRYNHPRQPVGCRDNWCRSHRQQVVLFLGKASCGCLAELAKRAVISLRIYPLHQQLIDMCQTVELPVTNEEVLLEVVHHALHFAFGSCPACTAGTWREIIVFCQLEEAVVEDNLVTVVMLENGSFLVINQHRFDATAKVGKGFDQ